MKAREAEAERPGRGAREVWAGHKVPNRYVPPGAVQSHQHTTASSFDNPAWCFVGGIRRGDCWWLGASRTGSSNDAIILPTTVRSTQEAGRRCSTGGARLRSGWCCVVSAPRASVPTGRRVS